MATILQQPISVRNNYRSTSTLHSSYTDLVTLDPSLPFHEEADLKQSFVHAEYDKSFAQSVPSTAPSSPLYTHSMGSRNSYFSTPTSYSSLDISEDYNDNDGDDFSFPSYENSIPRASYMSRNTPDHVEACTTESQATSTPPSEDFSISETVNDDQAIEHEPTQHVDYLSHDWKEEDIWSSWRYIVARRKTISNSVRLENASWRTWTKTKNSLRTVSPESLNWLKDCDVTWLYGPLQVETTKSLSRCQSPPPSLLSRSSSFLNKKTCLKKRSASAVILERSRSQQTLLQRAGEIIRVQQASPVPRRQFRRGGSEFSLPSYEHSSASNTPADPSFRSEHSHKYSFGAQTPSESKHVFFNEEVRQVRAIESEDDEKEVHLEEEEEEEFEESDEDDDGGLIMMPARSRSNKSTPRTSFSDANKTIAPLPSTTLKYRKDTPEPPEIQGNQGLWAPQPRVLSHSSSQETLKPTSSSSSKFLLDDDPELNDDLWPGQVQSCATYSPYAREDQDDSGPQMRRTASGMFMPYDENEEEAVMNDTVFGQAMYAFNTFKDIAHVVWNVGWSRGR